MSENNINSRTANWATNYQNADQNNIKSAIQVINHELKHDNHVDPEQVQNVFSQAAPLAAEKPNVLEALKSIVNSAKTTVMNTFLKAFHGDDFGKNNKPVQMVFNQAFENAGFENIDKAIEKIENAETKFTETQNALKANFESKEKTEKQEYFDWMDFNLLKANLSETKTVINRIKKENFNQAFVMGMGGSSMNGKFINSAFDKTQGGMDVEMMDSMDPKTLSSKLDKVNAGGKKPLYVFISKSGNTFEVRHVMQAVIDHLIEKNNGDKEKGLKEFVDNSLFVTEPLTGDYPKTSSKIKALIKELETKTSTKVNVINHPSRVGGRFSLFSVVGMLVSELKGLKSDEFLAGAEAAAKEFFAAKSIKDSDAAKFAVLDTVLAKDPKFAARYMMTYGDSLKLLPQLTAQLAGESNNKDNGDNPPEGEAKVKIDSLNQVYGLGPTSHHSDIEALCRQNQRMLMLDEIMIRDQDNDTVLGDSGLESMKDLRFKSLHLANLTKLGMPLSKYLKEKIGLPVVTTVLEKKNEYNIAHLAMTRMLATAIQAGIQGQLDATIRQEQVEKFKSGKSEIAENLGLAQHEFYELGA